MSMKRTLCACLGSISFLFSAGLSYAQESESSIDPDIRGILKLNPRDVLAARSATMAAEEAKYVEIRNPELRTDTYQLFLRPDEAIKDVFIIMRSPTNILFTDATGTHWPIARFQSYDLDLIGAARPKTIFDNSVVLYGNLPHGSAFVSVYLKDLPDPITLRVIVGDEVYHDKVNVKIMQPGPKAELTQMNLDMVSQEGLATDPDLNHAIYGVDPYGSVEMQASITDVLAWDKDGDTIIRSRIPIFSPPLIRVTSGTNGYTAYRFTKTSRLYATDDAGKVVEIVLRDK
jgi:hypothetical protein